MKRSATVFLQGVVVLVGIGALTFLLWEPHVEGRNANATPFEIYFHDPFLAYAYIASIPFFVALYKGFRVLGYAGRNTVFSPEAVKALRTIKLCALAIIAFAIGGEVFIFMNESDDRPPGIMMGVAIIFASIVVASAASVFERVLENAVNIKFENDLTV